MMPMALTVPVTPERPGGRRCNGFVLGTAKARTSPSSLPLAQLFSYHVRTNLSVDG